MHHDTVLYLQDVKSLQKSIHILRNFQMYSGLAINLENSELLVKSLPLSQLIYLFFVLPKPDDAFMKELDTTLYNFIWSNKPDKVSRKTVIGDYHEGGLRMIHIPSMIKGLKVA